MPLLWILVIALIIVAVAGGVAVPAELSVVGFDDSPVALHVSPHLTTVAQPHEEKGRLAAEWLAEDIARGTRPRGRQQRTRILPTELVVRESTAPPSGGS